jgi:hypothetical protein
MQAINVNRHQGRGCGWQPAYEGTASMGMVLAARMAGEMPALPIHASAGMPSGGNAGGGSAGGGNAGGAGSNGGNDGSGKPRGSGLPPQPVPADYGETGGGTGQAGNSQAGANAAVAGATGGTDAAAGATPAGTSGSLERAPVPPGQGSNPDQAQRAHASDRPSTKDAPPPAQGGGSPAAGAAAAGGTGLGEAARGDTTRTDSSTP